jgi:GxxExxY protein
MNADIRRSENQVEMDQVTQTVGAAFEVANVLGSGFLQRVYERALLRELDLRGLTVKQQVRFPIVYKGLLVGDYVGDLVVEQQVIVELKCAECLTDEHTAQCINYLKAAQLSVALLINFQKPRIEWKRIVNNF